MIVFLGALLGALSVALGAYVSHGPRDALSHEALSAILTALEYQRLHAVVIVCIGLYVHSLRMRPARLVIISAYALLFGVAFFSGSIYLAYLIPIPAMVTLTPIGGMLLMMGWIALACAGLLLMRARHRHTPTDTQG